MKAISWPWLVKSNFTRIFFTMAMVAFWTACSDDTANLNGPGDDDAAKLKANMNSTSSFNDYDIVVTVSTDGSEWTYTITKKVLSNGKTAKDLSHFIINLGNCISDPSLSATFSDILSAKVNGEDANFVNSEGSGTGCNPQEITSNFVKINDLSSAASWIIVIKFDRGYEKVLTKGWIKAGSSCSIGDVYGPGCPITEQCLYGQGRFFAEGYDNNGSIAQWPLVNNSPTLTIGGYSYSPSETNALWDVNTGQGQSDVMRAFFQLGALKLNQTNPPELADEREVIEDYFELLGSKVTPTTCSNGNGNNTFPGFCTLPSSSAVSAATATIGDWIAANDCEDLD